MSTTEKIKQLRDKGYTVRVNHVRGFDCVGVQDDNGVDNMLTRGEFTRACQDGKLVYFNYDENTGLYIDKPQGIEFLYGEQVSPKGGFTTVVIEKDGQQVAKGKYSFGSNNAFTKRIGLSAAFGRALKQISE